MSIMNLGSYCAADGAGAGADIVPFTPLRCDASGGACIDEADVGEEGASEQAAVSEPTNTSTGTQKNRDWHLESCNG